jgi:hypothetical protein
MSGNGINDKGKRKEKRDQGAGVRSPQLNSLRSFFPKNLTGPR